MITMPELLEDPVYWNFILQKPKSKAHTQAGKHPIKGQWVVYFRKTANSKWKRKSFKKYKDARKFFWHLLKDKYYDFNLGNRRVEQLPPKRVARIKGKFVTDSKGVKRQVTKEIPWKPKLSGDEQHHKWCKYCRRPTVFRFFSKHPALVGLPSVDPNVSRCTICGISDRMGGIEL